MLIEYDEGTQDFKVSEKAYENSSNLIKCYKKITKVALFMTTYYKAISFEE